MSRDAVFDLWTSLFIIENIGRKFVPYMNFHELDFLFSVTRIFCYTFIFVSAYWRLPEFRGYRPVSYPGTVSPRKQTIAPRRMNLPPSFASDWKKIGSKRSDMMMLDVPLWSQQIRKQKSDDLVQVVIHN